MKEEMLGLALVLGLLNETHTFQLDMSKFQITLIFFKKSYLFDKEK